MQLREAVGRAEMAGFSSDALDVASAIIDEIAASEEALRAAIGDTDASPADTEQDHRRGTAALEAALARARDLRIVSGECHRSARPSAPSFGPPVSDGGRGFKSLRCAHARAAPLRALIISGGGRLGPTTQRGVVCHGMGLP